MKSIMGGRRRPGEKKTVTVRERLESVNVNGQPVSSHAPRTQEAVLFLSPSQSRTLSYDLPTHFSTLQQQYSGDSTVESLIEYGNIVRQEFLSENEAQEFFNSYANQKGFTVRKSKVRRLKRVGSIYYRTFVCFRSGYREEKKMNVNERKRKPRSLTRCCCPVKFSVKLDNKTGRWYVHEFYDVHNHEMAAFS